MNKNCFLLIVLLLGAVIIAGCVASTRHAGYETAYLPLNEGVKDLSFLTSDEVEILEAVNMAREARAAGPLSALKISRGLSFASKERAEELARPDKPVITKEEGLKRLFGRVRKFGTFQGGIAETDSYGYYGAAVVTELVKESSATKKQFPPYFMDAKYAVMGTGCTQAGYPAPICVITFASGFEEAR